jgi:hypothetical protein
MRTNVSCRFFFAKFINLNRNAGFLLKQKPAQKFEQPEWQYGRRRPEAPGQGDFRDIGRLGV